MLGELPPGTHVLIMTHDHAEDAALCDAVLREGDFGSIGLIGSAGKWGRFRRRLADEGHAPEAIARITTPIGLPELTGKDPATIAVGVAASLLRAFERDRGAGSGRAGARLDDAVPGAGSSTRRTTRSPGASCERRTTAASSSATE